MKTLLALLALCTAAAAQSAIGVGRGTGRVASSSVPLAVVQSAKATGNAVTSLTVTLPAAPVTGRLLLVFMGLAATSTTPTTPSGTWAHVGGTSSAHARMDVWTHTVVSGDGTSYSFTSPVASDRISLVMYEVAGANATTPVNQSSLVSAGSSASITTPALTPSAVGTLGLSAVVTNSPPSSTAVSSGWAIDQNALPLSHATATATRTALTSDTSTAISSTFTFSSAQETIAANVLIGP